MSKPIPPLRLPDGRACLVRVALPPGHPPAAGWPVAYVLDLQQFEHMAARPAALPGLLVGLGPAAAGERAWDYTPRWAGRPAPPPGVGGHAAAWLRTLDRVRARVAAGYPLDPGRQVFCGHSLAALFGLYTLAHRPRAFDGYVLSSPSVWWGGGYAGRLLCRRRQWLCTQGLPPLGVFLSVGEHEQGLGPDDADADEAEQARRLARRRDRAMVDGMHALAAELARCPGLRLHSAVLPGHGHRSAPHDALLPGWRWLLAATRRDEEQGGSSL